jgi:hypothetical protein
MNAVASDRFRKETQAYLKDQIGDVSEVANATDAAIDRLARQWLEDGGGNKHFSWDAALVSLRECAPKF